MIGDYKVEFHLGKVTIVGVGLLGASIGMAIRQKRLSDEVIGIGRNITTLKKAMEIGAVDTISTDLISATKESNFLILCTPVQTAISMLKTIAEHIPPTATITDVCSTKKKICQTAQSIWQKDSPFIGSHPLAGSEKYGPEHGKPDFYENTICLIEKGENTRPESKKLVCDFWKMMGANTIEIDAEEHDYFMAYTSHLPHILASALAQVAGETGAQRHFIGSGFIDTTRIAESRPEIWSEISMTNKNNILSSIEVVQKRLDEFKILLEKDNSEQIIEFFKRGNESRKRLLNK